MTQGERIREVRKTLGLTLEKFGEKIGMKRTLSVKLKTEKTPLLNRLSNQSAVNLMLIIYG